MTFVAALLLMLAFATQASAATYTVNTTADTPDADVGDGVCADAGVKCSLRAAVEQSNDSAGADTIILPAGRYVASGLEVAGPLTLTGAGAADTIIDSDGEDTAIVVQGQSSFTGSGFTVTGGFPCGCFGEGGAFDVTFATLDLTDVRLTRNQVSDGEGDGLGGAIAAFGSSVKLTRVRVDHNAAFAGGGIYSEATELEVVDSVIEGNSALILGGGIAHGPVTCERECGPGDALVAGAAANLAAPGEDPGRLLISGSTLNDNVAGVVGGALYNVPDADEIGAFVNGVEGDPQPEQTIVNSTLSGNIAGTFPICSPDCGGAGGGAIFNANGNLELNLINDTIAENHSLGEDSGGNITSSGIVNLRNTIVANGTSAGVHNNCVSFHEGNRFVSLGNNLGTTDEGDGPFGCNLSEPSDKRNTDPKLGLLADNGGPTPTHALRDGSPAIDAGSNDAGPALDQRGGDRPPAGGSAGETRDVGAYEAYSLADLSVEAKGASATVTAGQPLTYTLVVRNSGPDAVNGVTLADALPGGVELISADGCTGGITCALGTLAAGEVKVVTVVVRPAAAGTLTNTATVSAAGITDTNAGNDSASASTEVGPAPTPPQQQPQQQPEPDKSLVVNLDGPNTATINQFMNGIIVEADCKDEECLRRFREHAAINTGASHIAGFNLTVSRGSLALGSKKTKFRLRPCQSGSKNGRRHKRCLRNLRKAAKKAKKFKVKVVVSAVDAAGNKDYAKTFVTVGG